MTLFELFSRGYRIFDTVSDQRMMYSNSTAKKVGFVDDADSDYEVIGLHRNREREVLAYFEPYTAVTLVHPDIINVTDMQGQTHAFAVYQRMSVSELKR